MSYDAFATSGGGGSWTMTAAAAADGRVGGGWDGSSAWRPAAPATHAAAAAVAVAPPVDESARAWLMRDSTLAQVPDAIKQLQGSVPLFTLLPCDDPTVAAGGAAASAAGSHSFSLNPRLHGGELVELFARSGVGKTEMLYQCVATTLLPKHLSSSLLPCRVRLDGEDYGAVVLDGDFRFSVSRLEQIIQARIRRAFDRDVQRHASAMRTEEERVRQLAEADARLADYLQSDEYAALRTHCLSCLFVFRAQTPRQMLSVLHDIDECCQQFNTSSWQQKQEQKEKKQSTNGQSQSGDADDAMEDIDITGQLIKMAGALQVQRFLASPTCNRLILSAWSSVTHSSDPSFNPRLSSAAAAVAASSRSSLSASSSPPRIAVLCIDNVAAMHWLVKGQPPGFGGMALGLDTPERMALCGSSQATRGDSLGRTWFYDLFTQQLRALLHSRQLIAIATKPPISNKGAHAIQVDFSHEETLSLSWNSLVTHRIVIRDKMQTQAQRQKQLAGGREERHGAAESVLRECLLKDIGAASKAGGGAASALAQAVFTIRISADGVTAERPHA